MKHQILALALPLLIATPLSAQWTVEAFAGGGFSGRNVQRAVEHPAFLDLGGRFIVSPDSVDLVKSGVFDWRPTLTTGVTLNRALGQNWQVGLGGYFAFLTEEDGQTSPFPGLSLHLGQNGVGFFVGYIFTASDDIAMPEGQNSIRVSRDAIPDLRTRLSRGFGRLIIGFEGVSLNLTGG